MKLTQASVKGLSLPSGSRDKLFFDDELPGFGFRIRDGGKRTWIAQGYLVAMAAVLLCLCRSFSKRRALSSRAFALSCIAVAPGDAAAPSRCRDGVGQPDARSRHSGC